MNQSQRASMKSMTKAMELSSDHDLGLDFSYSNISSSLLPPSRAEWERYRPLITTLYIDMKMPLSELIAFMKDEYKFKATPRMYKQRFKDWQIYKYSKVATRYNPDPHRHNTPKQPRLRPRLAMNRLLPVSNDTSVRRVDIDLTEVHDSDSVCCDSSSCFHRSCVQAYVSKWSWEQLIFDDFPLASSDLFKTLSLCPTSKSGCVEKVLYYVNQFSEWWTSPGLELQLDPFSNQEAARITQSIVGHCAHHISPNLCERCTWAEFDYGLAMLELGQTAAAFTSFELGCRLARLLLSRPSKLFIRNLFMAFGSNRWEAFEPIRQGLLSYLAGMANLVLGPAHPITIILNNTACDDILKRSAEFSLKIMIELFDKDMGPAHADVLLIKRSLSVVLRRQEDFEPCEEILLAAIRVSEAHNGDEHKETRRCYRRLAHLYMQRCWWEKAEEICLQILDSAPEFTEDGNPVPDEISVYTYQHLADIANSKGDYVMCRTWFSKELVAAVRRWGPKGDYSAECIRVALLQNKQSPNALSSVVESYPGILDHAWTTEMQSPFIISKARWCAVRNLI